MTSYEKLNEKLLLSHPRPNNDLFVVGNVSQNALNQIVPNSNVTFVNPQLNGPMRIPNIPTKQNRVLTKYENKRRSTETQEALYDWRNNVSLNNSTRVPANYYQNKLTETAKNKVRNKYMMENYGTQFKEFNTDACEKNISYDTNQLPQNGLFTSKVNISTPTYNPLLPISDSNKPNSFETSFPDERMTHQGGDRTYTTKGDRLLNAHKIATSTQMKERNQLQIEANNALKGIHRVQRKTKNNCINPNYYHVDEVKNDRIKDGIKIENIKSAYKTDLNTTVKQNLNPEQKSVFENFQLNPTSVLHTYSSRSTDLTKRTRLQQMNEYNFESIIKKEKKNILKQNREMKEENENLFSSLIEGFKNFFVPESKRTKKEQRDGVMEKYEEEISSNKIIDDEKITDYDKKQHRHTYWVVKDNTKFEYNDDYKKMEMQIQEPILMIQEGKYLIQNMITREVDGLKVHQRKQNLEDGETEYNLISIPMEIFNDDFIETIERSKEDKRYKEIINLDFENHMKLANLTEIAPDDFKINTKKPITYHQRTLTEDPKNILTNINNIDDYLNHKLTKDEIDNYLKKDSKINFISMLNKRENIEIDKNNREFFRNTFENPNNNTLTQHRRTNIKPDFYQVDPRKFTKRFNN